MNAKGNMTSGNGLGVTYTSFDKPATITRGTASISVDHDPEHQRYAQTSLAGVTLYLSGGGVLAEKFGQLGGAQRWTNYLIVGGRLVGIHVENSDETTATRYFHTDHLGSIAVISDEAGAVVERLSYDAWGVRRHPDGTPDPSGSISSQSSRGFTGQEHLAEVGLIHMNGRVHDPLIARFGTPDPMTEDPFSTQGWNRYSYVGNSPVNFTDPTGYCFLGCFWKPIFKAIGNFFKQSWRAIVQIGATALICGPAAPVCAGVVAFAITGVTSGDLGLAMKAGLTAFATAFAMNAVGDITGHQPTFGTEQHLQNIAGHALVGCASSVTQGGKCGPGALSGAVGSFVSPLLRDQRFGFRLVATSVLGGAASAAAGGNFGNGALMAAFGYLFNEVGLACGGAFWPVGAVRGEMHCGLFVYNVLDNGLVELRKQFSYAGYTSRFNEWYYTTLADRQRFWDVVLGGTGGRFYPVDVPAGMTQQQFDELVIQVGNNFSTWDQFYWVFGPNSNTAVGYTITQAGGTIPQTLISGPYTAPGIDWFKTNPYPQQTPPFFNESP